MREKDHNKSKFSRRKALAGLGSLAGFSMFTGVVASQEPEYVELPAVRNGEEVIRKESYPVPWVEHQNHVSRVKDSISEGLIRSEGVHSVGIIADPDVNFDEFYGQKIRVGVSNSDAASLVSQEVDGIPITVKQEPQPVPLDNCDGPDSDSDENPCYWNDSETKSRLGGGLEINVPSGSGTTACRVFDTTIDEYRLLTAAHVIQDGDCNAHTYASYNGETIGAIDYYSSVNDFATIRVTNSKYTSNGSDGVNNYLDVEPSDQCLYYQGFLTKEQINARASKDGWDNDPQAMGKVMGHTSGDFIEVESHFSGPGCTYLEEGVKMTNNVIPGDSGGPSFIHNPDSSDPVRIVGLSSLSTDETNRTSTCNGEPIYNTRIDTPAYLLNSKYDLEFN